MYLGKLFFIVERLFQKVVKHNHQTDKLWARAQRGDEID